MKINRRKMFQVAAVYIMTAWLIIQIITSIEEPLSLPLWSDTLVIVLLGLGFPILLIISWLFNLTPDGLMRETVATKRTRRVGHLMELVLLGVVAIAGVWFLYQTDFAQATQTPETRREPASVVIASHSLVVLPFNNLSPKSEYAHFSAGLHGEILGQLAKLGNLKIVSHTSVQQYADSNLTIPEIAPELNVTVILEGSVQYADDGLRVNAKLIDAATDELIWAQTYDREFEDIFAIESDIATSIANSVKVEFSLTEQEGVTQAPTEPLDVYLQFLGGLPPPEPKMGPLGNNIKLGQRDGSTEADSNFAIFQLFPQYLHSYCTFSESNCRS